MTANTRHPNGPVVIGHPGESGKRWHGWGWYAYGPDFDSAKRFYAVRGEDALGLAVQHFGVDVSDLRYFGYNY